MKKMSFKCIFNWLYAKTLDRAMSDRQPREDRETISPVYRPVCVSYVSAFLSSMCSQWGLLALARRIYSSKDNSVCLSRCGWSASRISLVALLLLLLGGWNSDVLGANCNYNFTKNEERTSIHNGETIYRATINGNYYGLSSLSFHIEFSQSLNLDNRSKDLSYDIYLYNNSTKSWSYRESKTLAGYGVGTEGETITYTTDLTNITAFKVVSTTDFGQYSKIEWFKTKYYDVWRTVEISGVTFQMASTISADVSSIDFGSVTYGNSSDSKNVVATYTLNYDGNMSATCTGDFSATIGASCNCSTSQQSKTITVKFTPTQAGTRTGTLTISNPDGTNTTVSLSGTGKHANPTLKMNNGSVNVTTDQANPVPLNLANLKASGTTSGIGDFDYFEVRSADASTGAKIESVTINGNNFSSIVGGTYTVRAITKQNNQYNSTYTDFTVTVNRLTQTISWTPANLETEPFVEEDVISATSIGDVTLTKSGAGVEYVTIEGNTATVGEVETNSSVTLTATAAQTDVYAEATDSKTITLTSLQKQHITFNQNLTKLKTTDDTKKVELVATSDSGRDSYITFAVDANAAGVSVTQEDGKWYLNYTATAVKGIAVTASLAGVEGVSIAASDVSQMVKVTDPTAKCDITETLATAYGIKSTDKVYDLTIPKEVVLKVRCSEKSRALVNGYDIKFYNAQNQQVGSTQSFGGWDTDQYNTQDVKTRTFSNLDKNITKLVFTSNAKKGYDITEASYTRWSYANTNLSDNRLDFEAQALSTVADQTFTLDYANYQIELSIEGSSNFVLKSEDSFGDCETYGSKTVKVGYNVPSEAMKDTAYLRIKDNTDALLNTVELHATVIGGLTQNITSTNIKTSYLTTDLVNLTATTDRGLTNFSYSATPEGVANFDGAQMTFSKSDTIAITVTEAGNGAYAEASTTVKDVIVSKATPAIVTAPTGGTEIQYLQTLENSTIATDGAADITLRGEEHTPVAGKFAWTDPKSVIKNNAGEHMYEVTFTPTDGGMYATNTCMVPVTILRAPQAIAMNNGTVRVAVGGIDEGKADSKIDLDNLIASQTIDTVNANRAGAVTYEVISENKATAAIADGNIFSATAIGDYTIRATKAQTDYYNAVTDEFVVKVSKRANTLATAAAYTQYVDDTIKTVATVVNSDGEIHTSSTDATIAYYDIANNKIVIPNSEAKSFDQTEVTIKIWQDGTTRFDSIAEADAKTITLTVKKHDNPFACSWGAWTKTINFDEVVPVEFTAANTDYAHFPIKIVQTSGATVATLANNDATHNTITASYVRDDATWRLSQAESYKYKADSQDVKVQVRVLPAECYVLEDYSEHKFSTSASDFTGHYDDPITVSGPVNKIYFEAKMSEGLAVNKFIAEYSVDNGANWRTLDRPNLNDEYQTFSYTFKDKGLQDNERVTHIRFGAETGATFSKWYRNIKISRATNIKPLDKENNLIKSMTMPQNTVGGTTTEKFYMKFSSCDEVVKLASNNSHFTLDKVEIARDPSKDETEAEVTVTYSSDEVGTHNGVITLYTRYQIRTFTITGTTAKKVQTITWKEGFTGDPLALQKGLVVNNTNVAATASSERPVMYTSGDENIIKITLGGMGFTVVGEGTTTLTASEAGDDYVWAPVSETKTIHATGKPVQTIIWDQNLVNDLEPGQVIELDAKVYIRDAATGDLTYNAERTALINYSCSANSVISLDGKTITVTGYGQTSITATIAGNSTYMEAQPVVVAVRVREPSTGCETPLVLDHPENVRLYSTEFIASGSVTTYTTPEVSVEIELELSKGKPDKLSYKHNGELASIPVFGVVKLCGGAVKVQERVNGKWDDVEGSYFNNEGKTGNKADYNWRDVIDLQLNENADAIRFLRERHGSGAHNFKDIQITLLQYIRPVQAIIEAGNVLDLGDITEGEARAAIVSFDYSDVKGEILATKGNTEDAVLEINEKTIYLECGSHGQYDLPITLNPTVLGPWSNTITLTDRLTNVATTITVKANVIPGKKYTFNGGEDGNSTQWGTTTNWKDNEKPGVNDNVIIQSDVEIIGNVTVGSLTIDEGATVTVTATGHLTIGDGSSYLQIGYGDLHVVDGGAVTLGSGAVMVRDFILDAALGNTSQSAASGQLDDENRKMVLNRNAYFDLSFDPSDTISYGWYDFTVPFEVNINGGISRINSASDKVMVSGTDFIIMEADEQNRANGGKGWRTLNGGSLKPGKLYTITLDDDVVQNTLRFAWNRNGALHNGESYNAKYAAGSEPTLNGWNGLGNGMLCHGYPKGSYKMQTYSHSTNSYELVNGDKPFTFAVGSAFFIQVAAEQNIEWKAQSATDSRPLYAPQREAREVEEFRITLSSGEADPADVLYFSANEDATEAYVIGRDLVKMGDLTDSKVARMWATKGGKNLCDIEAELINSNASAPIVLYAPQAGAYTIAVDEMPEDANLYLTHNGSVIWDLTASPYSLDLTKGTTAGYGLQLEAVNAPQITTGVDEIGGEKEGNRKVLINNEMYIVTKEGAIFNVTGKKVK